MKKEREDCVDKAAQKVIRSPGAVALCLSLALLSLFSTAPAHAGGFGNIDTTANTFMTWLKGLLLVIMTICFVIVGVKKANGASWGEVFNVAVGGAIAGSATALAAIFATPD